MIPSGLFVDSKAWDTIPRTRYCENPPRDYYEENPPDDWEECGQCDCYHPPNYTGDCRSDINRWPSNKCIAALTGV